MKEFHQPVLLKETIEYLAVRKEGKYIDATVGGGGHSALICQLGGKVLGLDCDPEALDSARKYLSTACPAPTLGRGLNTSWRLVSGNFKDLKQIALANDFAQVDGIFFDLGVSSYQLGKPKRGFSFNSQEPLDMRMDPSLTLTAQDLINGLGKRELEKLFWELGGEIQSRRLARFIVEARKKRPIKTCQELSEIIVKAIGNRRGKIHPATKVFQALRIAVNDELNNLRQALPQAVELLGHEGRLVVISFHSGEDRIVKQFFKKMEGLKKLKILTKKPITPSEEEKKNNPRSRSAKLRAAEKNDEKKD
jgi:16S rRNA (cytosine1402-N4)-methyltransferase